MTKNAASNKRSLSISANVAVAMAVGALLSSYCFSAGAQQRSTARKSVQVATPASTPADLDRAFWLCDYAGTTGSVDTNMAIACTAITEELTIKKFSGDFDAMVAWWRKHKPAEHQAIEAATRAGAGTVPVTAR
jgi:hypothetical protein